MTMTERGSLRNGLQDLWGTMRLIFGRSRSDAGRVYDVIGADGALGEKTKFLNLGYWKDTSDYDEAAAALARELGKSADIREGDVIVDAGFGFGDQDILWARECRPSRIVGFNLNAMQVETAQARIKRRILRMWLSCGTVPFWTRDSKTRVSMSSWRLNLHFTLIRERSFSKRRSACSGPADGLPRPMLLNGSIRKKSAGSDG